MKTLNTKYLLTVILLLNSLSVLSQSDYKKVFYTNDVSIDYSAKSLNSINTQTGEETQVPSGNLDNINTVSFINDSMIYVSGNGITNAKLNINKINSISIKSGSNTALGIGAGTLVGVGLGALIISSTDTETDPFTGIIVGTGNILLGTLTAIACAVVGGIIGSNISSYDKYYMDEHKFNKKQELVRILRIDGKLNGVNY